jgi:hypothetical protein
MLLGFEIGHSSPFLRISIFPFLQMSIDDILASFEEELESSPEAVNMRIKEGENKDIKITGKGDNIKWSLPVQKGRRVRKQSYGSGKK